MRKTPDQFKESLSKPKILGTFAIIVTTALFGANDKKDNNSTRSHPIASSGSHYVPSFVAKQSPSKSSASGKSFWSFFGSSSSHASSSHGS